MYSTAHRTIAHYSTAGICCKTHMRSDDEEAPHPHLRIRRGSVAAVRRVARVGEGAGDSAPCRSRGRARRRPPLHRAGAQPCPPAKASARASTCTHTRAARAQWQRNYSVYTGLGGLALLLLRAGAFSRERAGGGGGGTQHGWEWGEGSGDVAIRRARALAERCIAEDRRERAVSFFCGPPGYRAIAAAAAHALGDVGAARAHAVELLRWVEAAVAHEEAHL